MDEFSENAKKTFKQIKTAKMSYIRFWVHWLAEHTPKYTKYQFIKFCRLTVRDPREGVNNYFEINLFNLKASFNRKPKSTIKRRKIAKMTYILFWVHCLA